MRFVEDRDGSALALTCPYCLHQGTYMITTASTISCHACGRDIRVIPNEYDQQGDSIAFRASPEAQDTHLSGQHRAYQFGRAAVFSPLVGNATPRLWKLGRPLLGCNAILVWVALSTNPGSVWTLLMLTVSYLLGLAFVLLRVFLWGSIRIADIEETRSRDIVKHHRAFERGYTDTVNSID